MGVILMIKHILILLVILVGLLIGLVVVPRMQRAAPAPGAAPPEEFLKANRQLHRLSKASTIGGVAILTCAAFLW
jgi:putative copper export protein